MSVAGAVVTRSEAETEALAARLGASLRAGDVVALRGELGAGKTRFVRGLVLGLGGDPRRVSSPTFVLTNHYPIAPGSGPAELVHIDAYRMRGAEELESIGWEAILESGAVVAVEWPERIESALPAARFEVVIEHAGAEERRLAVRPPAGRRVDWS